MAFLALLTILLAACGGSSPDEKRYAFVTDADGAASDRIAQAWAGTQDAASLKPCAATIYTPSSEEETASDMIRQAVKDGAKVVVTAGPAMADTVATAQRKHKKVKFIWADAGDRTDADAPRDNTCIVTVDEEDAGYLAGYALVMEGYRDLGFLGGEENAAGILYGSGFVKGAEQAAAEQAINAEGVHIRMLYTGDTLASPVKMDTAMRWYEDGCRVIFAPDPEIRRSAEKAAELSKNAYVAGTSSKEPESFSERQLLVVVQDYESAVQQTIRSFEEGAFKGGETVSYGAIEGCVKVQADFSRFRVLTDTMNQLAVNNLRNAVVILTDEDARVGTEHVKTYSGDASYVLPSGGAEAQEAVPVIDADAAEEEDTEDGEAPAEDEAAAAEEGADG